MDITKIFFDNLPWSLSVLLIPIVLWYMFTKEKSTQILNEVMVFFKGGTFGFYPLTFKVDEVTFTVEENEYNEPITCNPRIGEKNDKMTRLYLFSEGIGLVDVPLLTDDYKQKAIIYLKEHAEFEDTDSTLKDKDWEKWTVSELTKYIKLYQFDIEHTLGKPLDSAFNKAGHALNTTMNNISRNNRERALEKVSNLSKLAYIIAGILIGAGFAWAFALKGYI